MARYHHHELETVNTILELESPSTTRSVLKKPIPNTELMSDGGRKMAVMI